MSQSESIAFPLVVETLRQLCAEERTGTVFIVSDDNRMAQVHLHGGDVAAVLCRGRRGHDALLLMQSMARARLRFEDGPVARGEADAAATQAILAYLDGSRTQAPNSGPGKERRSVERTPLVAAAAPPDGVLSATTRAIFERILTEYIGPMAQIICQDHFDSAKGARLTALALAGEIPNQAHAARFLSEVGKALQLQDL